MGDGPPGPREGPTSRPISRPASRLPYLAQRFSTTVDVPLVGDVDLEDVLANSGPLSLKGLFFARYVDEAWPAVHEQLLEPPPKGKYHAFEAYPMSDYARLFDYVARARFPGSAREAYRLLGRGEVEVFAESTLGKVTFSMLGEPGAALLRYPDILGVVLKGIVAKGERAGPRSILITYDQVVGSVEQIIGVLEGVVMAFDATPALDVVIDDRLRTTVTVNW